MVPTSIVSGLTSITSVAWDHGSRQPRFATGSRDGTILVWTPSIKPKGTTPARKAPKIKWRSLQPFSAPPPIEILSSPTERLGGIGSTDIEFEAAPLSEWAPSEAGSEVVSISSSSSNDSLPGDPAIVDSPGSPVLDSLVTISVGHGGGQSANLP